MFPNYSDIIERAGEPDWYDDNGAPRYGPFHPRRVSVYSAEVALLLVACQSCGWRFKGAAVSPSPGWAAMQKSLDGLTGRAWRLRGDTLLESIIGAGAEVRRLWDARGLDWQRAVIAAVVDHIVLEPAVKGRNRFDPDLVRIVWRF